MSMLFRTNIKVNNLFVGWDGRFYVYMWIHGNPKLIVKR